MKINPIIQWWLTPKLVKEYVFILKEKRPKGVFGLLKLYLKHWILHPIKRRIAKYYLLFLRTFTKIKVIGITGSCGKTTTKEMLTSLLRLSGKAVSSIENIDPVFNIPTTILKAKKDTKYLILEMGVEFKNEMDFYLWFGIPDVGIITNIYPTHTEFFRDVKGVLKEKSKLVKALKEKGIAVLNNGDELLMKIEKKLKAHKIFFGESGDVKAEDESIKKNVGSNYTLTILGEKINIQLPIIGSQFVENSLAAASAAHALGIDLKTIKKGLESYARPKHRMRINKHKTGATILDDSYNNNPQAAIKAIDTLCEISKDDQKVVVMGDMLELGSLEKKEHKRVGEYIGKNKINYVIGVGKASKELVKNAKKHIGEKNVFWVPSQKNVDPLLLKLLKPKTTILIKGSRSIGLDKLVKRLS